MVWSFYRKSLTLTASAAFDTKTVVASTKIELQGTNGTSASFVGKWKSNTIASTTRRLDNKAEPLADKSITEREPVASQY